MQQLQPQQHKQKLQPMPNKQRSMQRRKHKRR
jgi:hypothetical protein